jgi:hypothetical protein
MKKEKYIKKVRDKRIMETKFLLKDEEQQKNYSEDKYYSTQKSNGFP